MALSAAAREQLKKEREAKSSGGGGNSKQRVDIPKGQSRTMRVIPRADPDRIPFVSGSVHWLSRAIVRPKTDGTPGNVRVPKHPLKCPQGKACPLCQVLWQVSQDKWVDSKDLFVVFGKKESGACVVLVREELGKGPQLLSAGKNHDGTGIYDKILRQYPDPDAKPGSIPPPDFDPYDVQTGFDFTLRCPEKDARLDFELSRWTTPLAGSPEELAKLIEQAEALKIDEEFSVTPDDLSALQEMADAVWAGTIKAPAKDASRRPGGEAPPSSQVDSLSTLETPPASQPAPAAASTAPASAPSAAAATPATPPPEDMAAKMKRMRETAAASKAA